jgi:hypothetical protein
MLLALLTACVHTAPHPAWSGSWSREIQVREEFHGDDYCRWETESLRVGDRVLVGAQPPEPEQNWCARSGEQASWFDVVGEDGAFLSLRATTTEDPSGHDQTTCATWNLSTGAPATLEEYDTEHAAERWSAAQGRLAAEHPEGGWSIDRAAFLVGKGHVSFCARRGADLALVTVR